MNIFSIKNLSEIRAFMMQHPLVLPAIYILLYFPAFDYLQNRTCYHFLISSSIDQYIPFIPAFVVPYLCWFLLVPIVLWFLMKHDRERYFELCMVLALCMTISLLVYFVFPNQINIRQQLPSSGIFCELIKMIRTTDPACNVCPSIHVANTMAVCLVAGRSKAITERAAVWRGIVIMSALIIMSTVFIDQHSVIDVIAGVSLSVATYTWMESKVAQMNLAQAKLCRYTNR